MNIEHSRTRLRQLFTIVRGWIGTHVPAAAQTAATAQLNTVVQLEATAHTAGDVLHAWRRLNALRAQAEPMVDTAAIPRWAAVRTLIRRETQALQAEMSRLSTVPPAPTPASATADGGGAGALLVVGLLIIAAIASSS